MHCLPRRILLIALVAAVLLLTACQVPLPYLPVLPADSGAVLMQDEADAGMPETEGSGSDTPSEDESDVASDDAATEEPEAAADGEGATTTEESVVQEPDEVTAEALPMATIVVRSLRIRSGPGIEHDVVAGANQGEVFPIVGQAFDCQWLQVEHPNLGVVWLSGLPQYTAMDTDCTQVAESDGSLPPTAAPTPAPVVEQPETGDAAAGSGPTPESEQQSAETPADTLPVDQGCYVIQNYLGTDLEITVTAQEREWSDSFQIGQDQEVPYCLLPGTYAIFIDAPPPWADLDDELIVQAGDRFFWPIRSGE